MSSGGESVAGVVGVFARANHPLGYGQCQGLDLHHNGQHFGAKAHGYVVVVVRCADWVELKSVSDVLGKYLYDTAHQPLPGFDPWHRGDEWYAGPYEMVWAAEATIGEARGMWAYFQPLALGDRPSYGDNRAMAYLDAAEVLHTTGRPDAS